MKIPRPARVVIYPHEIDAAVACFHQHPFEVGEIIRRELLVASKSLKRELVEVLGEARLCFGAESIEVGGWRGPGKAYLDALAEDVLEVGVDRVAPCLLDEADEAPDP